MNKVHPFALPDEYYDDSITATVLRVDDEVGFSIQEELVMDGYTLYFDNEDLPEGLIPTQEWTGKRIEFKFGEASKPTEFRFL